MRAPGAGWKGGWRSQLWRAAPAGDRDDPRHRSRASSPRRTARGAGPRRGGADRRIAEAPGGRPYLDSRRARHGRGLLHRQDDHGNGRWPRIGDRFGGTNPPERGCPGSLSGERDAMTVPLLEASDLHTYYGASHVLHGVSLQILPGECVTLMGRNGMGKTTTIRSLLGLTPARSGEVRVRGKAVSGLPAWRIAHEGIALVPEGRGVFPTLSVKENLIMAARPGRWAMDCVLDLFPRL